LSVEGPLPILPLDRNSLCGSSSLDSRSSSPAGTR
jgi:hypothetical protein